MIAGTGDIRDDALVSFYDQAVHATEKAQTAGKQVVKALDECNSLNRRLGVSNNARDVAESSLRLLTDGRVEGETGHQLTEDELEQIARENRSAARH
jgi:hypothetical protein